MRVLTKEEIVTGIKEHIATIRTRKFAEEALIRWFEGWIKHFEELPKHAETK